MFCGSNLFEPGSSRQGGSNLFEPGSSRQDGSNLIGPGSSRQGSSNLIEPGSSRQGGSNLIGPGRNCMEGPTAAWRRRPPGCSQPLHAVPPPGCRAVEVVELVRDSRLPKTTETGGLAGWLDLYLQTSETSETSGVVEVARECGEAHPTWPHAYTEVHSTAGVGRRPSLGEGPGCSLHPLPPPPLRPPSHKYTHARGI